MNLAETVVNHLTTDTYDRIGKEWVVKATSVKPVYSSTSYKPESPKHSEEAEQHRLEDQWERLGEARRAKSRFAYHSKSYIPEFPSGEKDKIDVKEKEDTGPTKSYRSEDNAEFSTEFRRVLGSTEPPSLSMSSMTNTSSNPSSTRPSSSSSSHQRTAPAAMRPHSEEPDYTMLDQFSASSRKRQASVRQCR
jgi:hypothetical protein